MKIVQVSFEVRESEYCNIVGRILTKINEIPVSHVNSEGNNIVHGTIQKLEIIKSENL